jgi:hypothetical protein
MREIVGSADDKLTKYASMVTGKLKTIEELVQRIEQRFKVDPGDPAIIKAIAEAAGEIEKAAKVRSEVNEVMAKNSEQAENKRLILAKLDDAVVLGDRIETYGKKIIDLRNQKL